ncbi:translation initiation factor if-2-related [Holotrichia oblita]|nr:translation initiation factor if-2-related [Holotrichia oblita]
MKGVRALWLRRKFKQKQEIQNEHKAVSLENLFEHIEAGKIKDLNIIVKADVQGSVEAVKQSLEKIANEEVRVRVIHGGVGAVNESDIMLASASSAIIVGFNVRPTVGAMDSAARQGVDVRLYRVIYEAIEDIEAAMKGMLTPKRNSQVRVVRDGIVIHEGNACVIKRFKDDVKEVAQGYECGLSVERFNDIKEGDVVEVYVMEEYRD